jgi:hypothetical protein
MYELNDTMQYVCSNPARASPCGCPAGRKPHSGQDVRNMTYADKPVKDAPGLKDPRWG